MPANPFNQATGLYVDPNSKAAQWCKANPTDPRMPAIRDRIATVPQARWVGGGENMNTVRDYISAATTAHQLPVLALYAIPDRDLGQYSAGGVATAAAYRGYIDQVTAAVADRPCVVQIETDSLIHCVGQPTAFQLQRFGMLQYAAAAFDARCPNTYTYLDGGDTYYNSAAVMAPLLVQAGVGLARGFSLNVGQFNPTTTVGGFAARLNLELAKYGLPKRGYIVDISRNGLGRPADSYIAAHAKTWWCNPPHTQLGVKPGLDGLLWIKRPGESDGLDGVVPNIPSGIFHPDLALALINGT